MKNFDSRCYSITDFLEWNKNNQLELSPRFQRRSVWTDNARSYLMDTIVRGKPIPKIFLRQKINPTTRTSVREVVDGQQRLRTILSYIADGFQISKRHNDKYGGLYFSQLGQVDDEIQTNILNYEIAADLLVNMPDSEILDVFGRLNSYAVVLNKQERINADHFGEFKLLADRIGHKYYEFWTGAGIMSSMQALRMGDVTMAADLLIAMIEGIKTKKQIGKYYDQYESSFPHDANLLETQFDETLRMMTTILHDSIKETEFRRIHVFYSLFTAIFHIKYGLKDAGLRQPVLTEAEYPRVRARLEKVDSIFATEDVTKLSESERQFLEDSRRATTDASVRLRRTKFLLDLIG